MYIKKTQSYESIPHRFVQNRSRYAILYPRHGNDSIKIVHPRKSKYLETPTEHSLKYIEFVEIKLDKRQVIILPMYWWYEVNCHDFGRIELDDTYSFLDKKIRSALG